LYQKYDFDVRSFVTILKERNDLKDHQDNKDVIDYKPEIQKLG